MTDSEEAKEIHKELREIMNNKQREMVDCMTAYDETVYRPALIKLRERCGKNGHVRGIFHDNGVGYQWYYCNQCGGRMDIQAYINEGVDK